MAARHAEIAGAGLSGLMAATRLAQLGWSVRLHERGSELRMFGAGIWLWENGLRSLEAAGALEAAVARAQVIKEWRVADEHGQTLFSRPMTADDRLLLPPRADLYEALIAAHPAFESRGDTASSPRLAENPYGARSHREARAITDGLPVFRLRFVTRVQGQAG